MQLLLALYLLNDSEKRVDLNKFRFNTRVLTCQSEESLRLGTENPEVGV